MSSKKDSREPLASKSTRPSIVDASEVAASIDALIRRKTEHSGRRTAGVALSDCHGHFGNRAVLGALRSIEAIGESSNDGTEFSPSVDVAASTMGVADAPSNPLDSMIAASLKAESAGLNLGAHPARWSGNSGVQGHIQRQELKGGTANERLPDSDDQSLRHVGRGGGQPLSPRILAKAEAVLGHSLRHVRVHIGGQDGRAADSLNASAFTIGSDIYFAPGKFSPGTASGMELLLHELMHVVQFDQGRITEVSTSGLTVSDPSDRLEQEAKAAGRNLSSGVLEGISAMDNVSDGVPNKIGSLISMRLSDGEAPEAGFADPFATESLLSDAGYLSDGLIADSAPVSTSVGTQAGGGHILRQEAQTPEGNAVDYKASQSLSLSVSIEVPLYPPTVMMKVSLEGAVKQSEGTRGSLSEVSGMVYIGVQFDFLFLTVDLGLRGRVKFQARNSSSPLETIKKGAQEFMNWKIANDFQPTLLGIKDDLNVLFSTHYSNICGLLNEINQMVGSGDWDEIDDRPWLIFDSPQNNIFDEVEDLEDEIADAFDELGATKKNNYQLVAPGIFEHFFNKLQKSRTQAEAKENYQLLSEQVKTKVLLERRNVLRSIEQCSPKPNDPNVGFEGSVEFVAGASVQASSTASVSGEASVGVSIRDRIGATEWDHDVKSSVAGQVEGRSGALGWKVSGKMTPARGPVKSLAASFSVSGNFSTSQSDAENSLSDVGPAFKDALSGVRTSLDPIVTLQLLGGSTLAALKNQKSQWFSADEAAKRSSASVAGSQKNEFEAKMLFTDAGNGLELKYVALSLKFETSISVGGALKSGSLPVEGSAKSGTTHTVTFNF